MIKDHQKLESVKRPLKLGEEFFVACLVKRIDGEIVSFTPVIDTPHSDLENGQKESHYHADYRFIQTEETTENGEGFIVVDERIGFKQSKPRIEQGLDGEIEHHILPVVSENHKGAAHYSFIKNSKLEHKGIHNGKCPHRGYDLSQEKAVDGIITCPLHNLRFEAETGNITKECLADLDRYKTRDLEYKKELKKFYERLDKIDNGSTITQKEYEDLTQGTVRIFRITNIPCAPNFDLSLVHLEIIYTDDSPPQPLENGRQISFKVKNDK